MTDQSQSSHFSNSAMVSSASTYPSQNHSQPSSWSWEELPFSSTSGSSGGTEEHKEEHKHSSDCSKDSKQQGAQTEEDYLEESKFNHPTLYSSSLSEAKAEFSKRVVKLTPITPLLYDKIARVLVGDAYYEEIQIADRERYCRFLFSFSEPPDNDEEFKAFVKRLHRLKRKRGPNREWTKSEESVMSLIQATSFHMVNAHLAGDQILKRQYIIALDALFDCFSTVIDNYVDAK